MAGFKRIWRAFPGFDVLANIESTNIIDVAPPGTVLGAGTGVVLVVGEFERGSFGTQEIFGSSDLTTKYGGLGFPTSLQPHDGAVALKSGGDELWNGNGFNWLRNKRFSGLLVQRVDNNAGSVQFSRLACLSLTAGPFNSEPGRTVTLQRDGATDVVFTLAANRGTLAGSGFAGDASKVWQFDTGTTAYVDQTSGFNDATDANCTPFPATAAIGDAHYVCRQSGTFSQITYDYANGTAGIAGVVAWEYWNGTAWTALAGVTDATAGFTTAVADGLAVTWTVPTDWARTSVNGVSGYWVRARVTTGYTTDPVLDQGFVDADNVTGFTGGEWVQVKVDTDATRIVTFTAADQTAANCIDRINAVLGQTIGVANGTQIDLQSAVRGSDGRIEVVGADSAATLAALGFVATPVAQVDTWTVTNVTAGAYTLRTALYVNGVLTNYDASYTAAGTESTTDLRNLLLAELQTQAAPGVTHAAGAGDTITSTGDSNVVFTSTVQAEPAGGDVTIATTTGPLVSVDYGDGNVPNVDVITAADAVLFFDAGTGISSDLDADGNVRVCNSGTPATGTLQATAGTALADFGFDSTELADANDGEDVTIPAGTRVQDSSASPNNTIWVTLEDIETGSSGGSFDAKVRPFTDDDTALASSASNVTVILDTLPDGFVCTNAASITRLTASQLDARYNEAIDKTLDAQSVAYKANMIASARGGRASINKKLEQNGDDATAAGLAARKVIVRPPLGTTRADAKSSTYGIGVGSFRKDRVMYLFPGGTTLIPEIQSVGSRVGTGFTDDGIIEVGADSFYCSVRSILPPEENAGQDLRDTNVGGMNLISLEDAYNAEQGGVSLTIDDYISFKANGIIALRFDRTSGAVFQSDVTSVNPSTDLVLADANRRFFADFVIDTVGEQSVKYVKKLGTPKRRRALLAEVTGWLEGLQAPNQPDSSRIDSYQVWDDSTDDQVDDGIMVFPVKVKMYPTMKTLVFRVEVGPTVTIEEVV